MQDVSTTITIEVEEFKRLLLDAHDAMRYATEVYKLREENKSLAGQVELLEKELLRDTDS